MLLVLYEFHFCSFSEGLKLLQLYTVLFYNRFQLYEFYEHKSAVASFAKHFAWFLYIAVFAITIHP